MAEVLTILCSQRPIGITRGLLPKVPTISLNAIALVPDPRSRVIDRPCSYATKLVRTGLNSSPRLLGVLGLQSSRPSFRHRIAYVYLSPRNGPLPLSGDGQRELGVTTPAEHFVNLRQVHFLATNFAAGKFLQRDAPSFAELEQLSIKLDATSLVKY